MLLNGHDPSGVAGRRQHGPSSGLTVCMSSTRAFDARFGEAVGGVKGGVQHIAVLINVTSCRAVRALPSSQRVKGREDRGLVRASQAEVGRPVEYRPPRGSPWRPHHVARSDDRHVRQHAHDGQVFGGVVRHSQGAVRIAGAHRHHHHVGPVMADVVADLLQERMVEKLAME